MSKVRFWLSCCVISACSLACATGRPAVGETPRAVVESFIAAMNRADLDGVMELFTADATAFLPLDGSPGRVQGAPEIAAALAPFFAEVRRNSDGPEYMHLTAKGVFVQQVDDVAVATFDAGSGPVTSRRTFVLRRTRAGWRVLHLHASNLRRSTS